MVERTRRLVANLADRGHAIFGDRWAAKKLGCSTRSVQRYLKELESTGNLVRTAVHMNNRGSWKSKRAMKLKSPEVVAFGVPRDTLIAMHKNPPKPKPAPSPRLDPFYMGEVVEGFGRPYHENTNTKEGSVVHIPASVFEAQREILRRAQEADPHDPEFEALRSRFVIASIRRATRRTT